MSVLSHITQDLETSLPRLKKCTEDSKKIQDSKVPDTDKSDDENYIEALTNYGTLRPVIKKLVQAYNKVSNKKEQVNEILQGIEDGDDYQTEVENWQTFANDHKYNEIFSEAEDEIDRLEAEESKLDVVIKVLKDRLATAAATTPGTTTTSTVAPPKLPDIELIAFNGDRRNWPDFIANFEQTINSRKDLTDATKLQYLIGLMRGTEATSIVTGYPPTDGNYAIVMNVLKETYGQQAAIVQELIRRLMEIQTPTKQTFQSFVQNVDKTLRQLRSFGEDTNTVQTELTIFGKLPYDFKEQVLQAKVKDSSWDTDKLMTCLKNLSKVYRELEIEQDFQHLTIGAISSNNHQDRHRTKDCIFCNKENHKSVHCLAFPTLESRECRLRELKLCFKCLEKEHSHEHCNRKCSLCPEQHHFYICKKNYFFTERQNSMPHRHRSNSNSSRQSNHSRTEHRHRNYNRSPAPDATTTHPKVQFRTQANLVTVNKEAESTSTFVNCISSNPMQTMNTSSSRFQRTVSYIETNPTSNSQVTVQQTRKTILPTTLVQLVKTETPHTTAAARTFLDTGSERSFISDELATYMNLKSIETEVIRLQTFNSSQTKTLSLPVVEVSIQLTDGKYMPIKALQIPSILNEIIVVDTTKQQPIISSEKPDLLIGSNYFWSLLPNNTSPIQKDLYKIKTKIGPVTVGHITTSHNPSTTIATVADSNIEEADKNAKSLLISNSIDQNLLTNNDKQNDDLLIETSDFDNHSPLQHFGDQISPHHFGNPSITSHFGDEPLKLHFCDQFITQHFGNTLTKSPNTEDQISSLQVDDPFIDSPNLEDQCNASSSSDDDSDHNEIQPHDIRQNVKRQTDALSDVGKEFYPDVDSDSNHTCTERKPMPDLGNKHFLEPHTFNCHTIIFEHFGQEIKLLPKPSLSTTSQDLKNLAIKHSHDLSKSIQLATEFQLLKEAHKNSSIKRSLLFLQKHLAQSNSLVDLLSSTIQSFHDTISRWNHHLHFLDKTSFYFEQKDQELYFLKNKTFELLTEAQSLIILLEKNTIQTSKLLEDTQLLTDKCSCIFCDSSDHRSPECFLTSIEKETHLATIERCHKCLAFAYDTHKCSHVCSFCKAKHHWLICRKLEKHLYKDTNYSSHPLEDQNFVKKLRIALKQLSPLKSKQRQITPDKVHNHSLRSSDPKNQIFIYGRNPHFATDNSHKPSYPYKETGTHPSALSHLTTRSKHKAKPQRANPKTLNQSTHKDQ